MARFGMAMAVIVAAVAVAVTVMPELLLMLPSGFMIWGILGYEMPPYFDRTPFAMEEFRTWTRPGDIIISVASKSGTTWMLFCAHQIRVKGSDDFPFEDVNIATPWIGNKHVPGQTWAHMKELLNTTVLDDGSLLKDHWNNKAYPFRIFKSHFGPKVENGSLDDVLPVKEFPEVKFIGMARNGMDVVASFYTFFAKHRPEFKKMWGGFPPSYGDKLQALKDFLPGGLLEYLYFGYIKSWWKVRHEKNVLLLHYADMKKDLGGGVRKLAEFLNVKLTPQEHDRVVEKCGFQYMKKHEDKFNYRLWSNKLYPNATIMCGSTFCDESVRGSVIYRGKLGDGGKHFTPEMLRLWNEA
eukprot:768380-Hanusia_phi.AAC.1